MGAAYPLSLDRSGSFGPVFSPPRPASSRGWPGAPPASAGVNLLRYPAVPAEAGIRASGLWIPDFSGMTLCSFVIPHLMRNPGYLSVWIPACAGMTCDNEAMGCSGPRFALPLSLDGRGRVRVTRSWQRHGDQSLQGSLEHLLQAWLERTLQPTRYVTLNPSVTIRTSSVKGLSL